MFETLTPFARTSISIPLIPTVSSVGLSIVKSNSTITSFGDTIEEAIADKEIDLVSITSPDDTHFNYAKMALEAGKHILVEKPFTSTVEEAEILFKLAEKKNKKSI